MSSSSKADSTVEMVPLRRGPIVPVEALLLVTRLTDLERPGGPLRLSRGAAGRLRIEPGSSLTDPERDALVRWKPFVLALIDYARRDDLDAHLREPRQADEESCQ